MKTVLLILLLVGFFIIMNIGLWYPTISVWSAGGWYSLVAFFMMIINLVIDFAIIVTSFIAISDTIEN